MPRRGHERSIKLDKGGRYDGFIGVEYQSRSSACARLTRIIKSLIV